ncbi:MAG: hypothetical protein KKH74_12195 [Gammaproteobacteria bacterium]|nr:hypothetical protein [Gammaproteobacteria bacterium]MBU1732465.1 hypothetical protein [Gammaproteobacteria bacterium]MBU1891748.1 hypothetical protein [Gammaproteobacteria bacterium]
MADETEMSSIGAQLDALIPKILDDIIRENRDKAELRLATEEEVCALFTTLKPGPVKQRIDDWYFINLHIKPLSQSQLILLGYLKGEGLPWITSVVTGIDLKNHLVTTRSGSIYAIGNRGKEEEPDSQLLATVCAVMHKWGMGTFLGVPPWFF